jgi:para-aminobenzoate synthetase component 1
MIVDLERNDLGRVCATGSVAVPRLAELRSFATVHHLVSSVRGRLRDPLALEALIAATFPGGSITGAPKLRAMQIIDCLEAGERGVYTGAIGRFDAAGGVDLSIAIRTAVVCAERLSLRVGSGIVADSDPELELAETRDKAQAFRRFCEVQA